jgi:hypothetical protein
MPILGRWGNDVELSGGVTGDGDPINRYAVCAGMAAKTTLALDGAGPATDVQASVIPSNH